jgi:hypothetical protein
MHVSWIYYAEYEKDGSGHKKPNYPSYAYSDDGGETFHKADGTPLRLPIHRAESDLIRDPMSLSRPGIKGYFEGYTIVCSMPDSTPYVYLAPKDPPQGSGRAIIKFDTEKKRWSEPMPMPFGATTFSIDGEGVISAVSSGVRVHRSYDGGQSWKTWDLGPPEPSFIWLDYSYTPKTNQLRFLAQRVSTGELVVYTVNFTKQ